MSELSTVTADIFKSSMEDISVLSASAALKADDAVVRAVVTRSIEEVIERLKRASIPPHAVEKPKLFERLTVCACVLGWPVFVVALGLHREIGSWLSR